MKNDEVIQVLQVKYIVSYMGHLLIDCLNILFSDLFMVN